MRSPPLSRLPLFHVIGAVALTLNAAAQTTKLIATGDIVPGLGTVTMLHEVHVNDIGDWVATVSTDQISPPWHTAFVRNGEVVLKPGDILDAAPIWPFTGGFIRALDDEGNFAWTSASLGLSGLWLDAVPYVLKGEPVVGVGVAPGTILENAAALALESSGAMIVTAQLYGTLTGLYTQAILRATPHGSGVAATPVLVEGAFLPGHPSGIDFFANGEYSITSNAAGNVLYAVRFFDGVDGVYRDADLLALAGGPSPIPGTAWDSGYELLGRPLALNDAGDYAFSGKLSAPVGTNELLVWNGIPFARSGDVLPTIAPYALTAVSGTWFHKAPIRLTQDGRVLWYGAWNDADTTRNEGIFLNHELVVQKGVTQIDGALIQDFPLIHGDRYFDISPDGSDLYVRALLADGRTGVFEFALEGDAQGIFGCGPIAGLLSTVSKPHLGETYSVSMQGAQSDAALPFLFVSTKPVAATPPCGLPLPGIGEILIDFTAPNPIAMLKGPHNGPSTTTPSVVRLGMVPHWPQLLGKTFYAQGAWLDFGASAAERIRLTNALALSIGL